MFSLRIGEHWFLLYQREKRKSWFRLIGLINAKRRPRDLVSNYDKDSKETSVTQCSHFIQGDSHRGSVLFSSCKPRVRGLGKDWEIDSFEIGFNLIGFRLLEIYIIAILI